MNLVKIALMVLVLPVLVACGTPIGYLGPSYEPIPQITERQKRHDGVLTGFVVNGRGMSPYQAAVLDKRVETLKSLCTLGVQDEQRRREERPNPDFDRYNRSLIAVGAGIREVLVVIDSEITIECIVPKRK